MTDQLSLTVTSSRILGTCMSWNALTDTNQWVKFNYKYIST